MEVHNGTRIGASGQGISWVSVMRYLSLLCEACFLLDFKSGVISSFEGDLHEILHSALLRNTIFEPFSWEEDYCFLPKSLKHQLFVASMTPWKSVHKRKLVQKPGGYQDIFVDRWSVIAPDYACKNEKLRKNYSFHVYITDKRTHHE